MTHDPHDLSSAPTGTALAPGMRVPASTLRFRFVRSRGPGGQNVNKVSTACELRLDLADLADAMTPGAMNRLRVALGPSRLTEAGEIVLFSDERRTQEQNRDAVLERLRDLLVAAIPEPKRRRKTKPSRASKQRRVEGKRRRSQIKQMRQGRGHD